MLESTLAFLTFVLDLIVRLVKNIAIMIFLIIVSVLVIVFGALAVLVNVVN